MQDWSGYSSEADEVVRLDYDKPPLVLHQVLKLPLAVPPLKAVEHGGAHDSSPPSSSSEERKKETSKGNGSPWVLFKVLLTVTKERSMGKARKYSSHYCTQNEEASVRYRLSQLDSTLNFIAAFLSLLQKDALLGRKSQSCHDKIPLDNLLQGGP